MMDKAVHTAGALRKVLHLLSSYRLATVIFLLLLLLVYLGTLDQIENGLFAAQQKYFNSLYVVHEFFGVIPMVLPGGLLLMSLLTVNLIAGGILRMRKGWSHAGIMVVHLGILLLMAGAFITFRYSIDGHMTLYERETSNEFQSYHDWEITLTEATGGEQATQFVIDGDRFTDVGPSEERTFAASNVPFSLTVSDFAPNCVQMPKGPMFETQTKVVNGYFLERLEPEKQNERNVAGIYASVVDSSSGQVQEGLLWGLNPAPWTVSAGGKDWWVELRRKRWQVPFTVVLDKFTRELHPGTSMPRVFMSDITKVEAGQEQKIKIAMNEPLRYKGYTFFQASWGPQDAGPNDPLFSTFAVVRNPADQFPLYACIVIAAGLLLHFTLKLSKYLRAETKRRVA